MAQLRSGARAAGGFSGGPLRRWGPIVLVVAGLTAVLVTLFVGQSRTHARAIAEATAAARVSELKGPPCPKGFSGAWANPDFAPQKALVFNGVRFARRAGHADCSAVAAGGKSGEDFVQLCQFSAPILVEVATEKGVFRFQPGVGHPATVAVADGQASCVLAANATF
ncbi:MAG: hypothetical protein ACK4YQ_06925 [Phenylobacterium sp.]|uniref:hypothetical protein n=1 Tax=Phenylobacterium sp. TaxID=1871053 RepID=UPI00391BE230